LCQFFSRVFGLFHNKEMIFCKSKTEPVQGQMYFQVGYIGFLLLRWTASVTVRMQYFQWDRFCSYVGIELKRARFCTCGSTVLPEGQAL
jgi:hypothetical protein